MEESDGVFAKRRRNILIVGVIIIILVVVNPILNKITLFEIDFNFEGKIWQIWTGLSIWFIYVSYRAWTYFVSNIRPSFKQNRRLFIYWSDGGKEFWEGIIEDLRLELLKENDVIGDNVSFNVSLADSRHTIITLKDNVLWSRMPFTQNVIYLNNCNADKFTVDKNICFVPNKEMKKHFAKRRRKYIFQDDCSEYMFIFLFAVLVVEAIIVAWLRILF